MEKVFLVTPTYKEPQKVELFLQSLKYIQFLNLEVVIVNANPDDETSGIIKEKSTQLKCVLTEIQGDRNEFWSASLNRALKHVLSFSSDSDWVMVANIDIEFDDDIVSEMVLKAKKCYPCQIGALCFSNKVAISSGIIVKSWFLTLTRHPFAGFHYSDVPVNQLIRVDYLPGRCLLFPTAYLRRIGLINAAKLPHYHADYEFSNRLSKVGCYAYIDTDARIFADMSNTGFSVYDNFQSFYVRFKNLWSIKNPSNPKYRINMVLAMYTYRFIPSAIMLYLLRSIIEVLFGSRVVKYFSFGHEKGFSGGNLLQKDKKAKKDECD